MDDDSNSFLHRFSYDLIRIKARKCIYLFILK
jgi:hypothetical protein